MGIFTFRRQESDQAWLTLDNAAKIYPAVTNKTRTSVFRLSVELLDPVNLKSLELALEESLIDFPYFKSHLRKGFFWYWLEPSESIPVVQFDNQTPCRSFQMQRRNHLLFRVLAKERTISAEFSHILTDGGGGMQFFQRMLFAYGKHEAWGIPESDESKHIIKETPDILEDKYVSFFKKKYPKPSSITKAYHLALKLPRVPVFSTTTAEMSAKEVLAVAKGRNVSLTEYLAAVYLFTLQKFYLQDTYKSFVPRKSVLRVQIPVNLRAIYNSNTLRNFALFVMPEIDPKLGAYSFDEITRIVHHYMQLETERRQIQRIITRNVGGEKNPLIRITPLLLKVPTLALIFNKSGPLLYSGVLTNLGLVRLPNAYKEYVRGFRFVAPPPDPKLKINAAVVSCNDRLILTFGNQTNTNEFEKEYFNFILQENIRVKILSQ